MLRRSLFAAPALLALPALAQGGWSPDRPIRVIYPYPPGGGGDIVGRLVTERMREDLGQPILFENRPGAAGLVGAELAARAPKDGYTVLLTAAALAIAPAVYRRMSFDPLRDLTALVLLTTLPLLIVTRPNGPLRDFAGLLAAARAEPDRITYATFGIGSPPHLVGERLLQETGTRMTHVPYTGGSVALPAILSGDVSIGILDGMSMLAHVREGRLRALAVSAERRMPQLPDVPTLAELGVPVTQGTWHGTFVPAGTPEAAVQRLHAAFVRAVNEPAVRDRILTGGAVPVDPPLSPAEWGRRFAGEVETWRAVAQRANVVVE